MGGKCIETAKTGREIPNLRSTT